VICFKVESLVEHPHHWQLAAQWSFEAWMHEFPSDTVQTYLDQYSLAASEPKELIEVFAAIDSQDNLLGVATLVDDDELPDAPEPGPWLAAVFVKPEARNLQIGSELVTNVVDRARELGYQKIYLYTEHAEDWYRKKGWIKIRDIVFLGLHHTVMQLELS
jgi:N-acetylglutamate synthase-like GNAT family acetyltransferase